MCIVSVCVYALILDVSCCSALLLLKSQRLIDLLIRYRWPMVFLWKPKNKKKSMSRGQTNGIRLRNIEKPTVNMCMRCNQCNQHFQGKQVCRSSSLQLEWFGKHKPKWEHRKLLVEYFTFVSSIIYAYTAQIVANAKIWKYFCQDKRICGLISIDLKRGEKEFWIWAVHLNQFTLTHIFVIKQVFHFLLKL